MTKTLTDFEALILMVTGKPRTLNFFAVWV